MQGSWMVWWEMEQEEEVQEGKVHSRRTLVQSQEDEEEAVMS